MVNGFHGLLHDGRVRSAASALAACQILFEQAVSTSQPSGGNFEIVIRQQVAQRNNRRAMFGQFRDSEAHETSKSHCVKRRRDLL